MHTISLPWSAFLLLPCVLSNTIPIHLNDLQGREDQPGPLTMVDSGIQIGVSNYEGEKAVNGFLQEGQCQAAPTKRDASVRKRVPNVIECLINDFQATLNALGENGALNGLRDSAMQVARNFPLPSFADMNYNEAFGQAVTLAADRVPEVLEGIAQEQIGPTTIFIFFIAVADYGQTFMKAHKLFLQTKSLLTDADFKLFCPKEGGKFFPQCDRFLCQGKDGKCTTDLMKPCACKADDKEEGSKCSSDVKTMPKCEECEGDTGKCSSGDQKDCECFGNTDTVVTGHAVVEWAETLNQIWMEVGDSKPGMDQPTTSPECNKDEVSEVRYTTFRGDANSKVGDGAVYKGFCDEVNKDSSKALAQVVDQKGAVIPPRTKRSVQGLDKRTPPSEPDASGATFALEWTGGDGSCSSGCVESFNTMVENPCSKLGGEQNRMAKSQKYDTGCGTYSYTIEPPGGPVNSKGPIPKIPQPGKIICKNPDPYTNVCPAKIEEKNLDATIDRFAVQLPQAYAGPNKVTSKMNNITQVWRAKGGTSGPTYMVNIGWVPGCTDYKDMVADNPQGKSGDNPDQSISCTTIFKDVYKYCVKDHDGVGGNHGIGGYRDYGCLRYGFYPTQVSGVWDAPPHPEKYWQSGEDFCPQKDFDSSWLKGCTLWLC